MRDAIGQVFALQVILIFVMLINGYMAYSVNYTRAFRVKNQIVNIIEEYPSFDQVTLTAPDGKEVRALRVNNYNPETLEYDYKYYTIDVKKVGDPNIGKGLYYSIVPDMDNELTGYEDKTVR